MVWHRTQGIHPATASIMMHIANAILMDWVEPEEVQASLAFYMELFPGVPKLCCGLVQHPLTAVTSSPMQCNSAGEICRCRCLARLSPHQILQVTAYTGAGIMLKLRPFRERKFEPVESREDALGPSKVIGEAAKLIERSIQVCAFAAAARQMMLRQVLENTAAKHSRCETCQSGQSSL